MAGKTTRALTKDELTKLVELIQTGGYTYNDNGTIRTARGSTKIATMAVIQANFGIRISDLVSLKPKNILVDGDDYMLDIVEKKTGKLRNYIAPSIIVNLLDDYANENNIKKDEYIFDLDARTVQKKLKGASEHLHYKNISTHSLRKYYATEAYEASEHDIALVSKMLLHADPRTTLRYIGISKEKQKNLFDKTAYNPLKKGV